MTNGQLGKPMPKQLPVERTLILTCGTCGQSHDARAVGPYDTDLNITYRADDGSDHEWIDGARVMVSTPEQREEAGWRVFDRGPGVPPRPPAQAPARRGPPSGARRRVKRRAP